MNGRPEPRLHRSCEYKGNKWLDCMKSSTYFATELRCLDFVSLVPRPIFGAPHATGKVGVVAVRREARWSGERVWSGTPRARNGVWAARHEVGGLGHLVPQLGKLGFPLFS